MIGKGIRIYKGNVADYNEFPVFSATNEKNYYLSGRFKSTKQAIILNDDLLTKGLLFLGKAGQGKTNTFLGLAGQILEQLQDNDLAIFFDLKGDYQEAFYENGDLVLDALNDDYVWNIFDELIPFIDNEFLLDMRLKELCSYLYKGRESSQQPFFVNAAREVTECIIRYFIYGYEESGDDSQLNNKSLLECLKGYEDDEDDLYDSIRNILLSYKRFGGALAYLPPREFANESAYGVLSEITSMANDVFVAAYGTSSGRDRYISAAKIASGSGANVVFLSYDISLPHSQSYVFRFFTDNVIANRAFFYKKNPEKVGKTYIFIDEFATLPKLEYLSRALSQMRGMGVCVIAGIQDANQIYVNYKEAEASEILGAFQTAIAFNCNDRSVKLFQALTGTARVSDRYSVAGGNIAYSLPYERKCVEERDIISLGIGEAYVKVGDYKPFRFKFVENRILKG